MYSFKPSMPVRCLLLVLATAWSIAAAQDFDHRYRAYEQVLSTFVCDGLVDYAGIQDNPNGLVAFTGAVELLQRAEYDSFSTDQKLAFWINVYNAYTLQLVVDHYPVKSIRDIPSAWKREYIQLFGEKISLEHIEYGILGKEFDEPRVRFALVRAARGCPVLPEWAYTADDLDNQLNRAARGFLADEALNRIRPVGKNVIHLSMLFKWYEDEFIKKGGTPAGAVSAWTGAVYAEPPKVKYMKFDWTLNGRE